MKAITINRETYDHKNEERAKFKAEPGLTEDVVKLISEHKNEPEWMLNKRLKAFKIFEKMEMPKWGPSLKNLDLSKITYFLRPDAKRSNKWEDVPEDIKNTFEKLGIPEAERKALAGAGAQYECLSEDSLVWTNPKGHVKIKKIKRENPVYSLDEKTNKIKKAKVLNVKCSGKKKIFEVRVGTRKVKASDNHPFLVLEHVKKSGKIRGRYHRKWKPLKDLNEGDLVAIATKIPDSGEVFDFIQPEYKTHGSTTNQFGTTFKFKINYNKVSLPEKSDKDIMWFLGTFLGDGYIKREKGREKARVNIAIPEIQPELRKELKKVISKIFGKGLISDYKYFVSINSSIVAKFLEVNGFSGNAHTKYVPEWIFSIPLKQKFAFLGGYLDSDGHVRKNEGDVSLTSANKKLLEEIKQLASYCNLGSSNVNRFESKHPFDSSKKITGYRLQLSGNIRQIESRYSFKKNRLKLRKYDQRYHTARGTDFRKHCSDYLGFAKIDSIKEVGIRPVYDIAVEGFHNFVSEGIIVHNSDVVYHNLKKEWEEQGVIFEDCDVAVQEYPELIKKYFMTSCVPVTLHKFAALHAAVWTGGTFLYVPKGVKMRVPVQAYFRMNAQKMGQFEHTLIIAEPDSEVHYIEGCFTKGSMINTNPDYKPIEKIKKGDKVLTHTGKYKKVYHTQVRPYTGDLYTIKFFGDSTANIEVTEEHPFLAVKRKSKKDRNKTWDKEWFTPKELDKLDYLAIPINKVVVSNKSRIFEVKKGSGRHKTKLIKKKVDLTKDFFRLIGYYLAEGSVMKNSYLSFSFGSHERNYIDDVKNLLKNVFGVEKLNEIEHKKNSGISVVVGSVVLARIFKQFGTSANKKNIPHWAMLEDPEKQKELIVGLFRGDGNYYKKQHKSGLKEVFRLNTVSEKLAKQAREILFRLKIPAFLNRRNRHKPRQPIYTVGITGEYLKAFGDVVGIKVKEKLNNKRRASMFFADDNYVYAPIKSVSKKSVNNLAVYNFGVEGDESYVSEGVAVHNCSAPTYQASSLHAGCVEIYVHKRARARYSSVENWSRNTYNLNTKRAVVDEDATVEWINGNLGSCVTMLYPCSVLRGPRAKSDFIGIAVAGKNQNQDTGCKIYHVAPNTTSTIQSKSISMEGGITTYRGLLKINKGAVNSKSNVQCDALMMDNKSRSDTIPYIEIKENKVDIGHEASVGKISDEQIFYLRSRGLSEEQARQMIVSGFIEPVIKELPLEYAVELNKLVEMEMEGSLG